MISIYIPTKTNGVSGIEKFYAGLSKIMYIRKKEVKTCSLMGILKLPFLNATAPSMVRIHSLFNGSLKQQRTPAKVLFVKRLLHH